MSPFDWDNFLRLAVRQARSPKEATRRTAINRAYYEVYHAASAFIRRKGLYPASSRLTHDIVWNALRTDPDQARAAVGVRGNVLKKVRVDADYRDPFPGDLGIQMRWAIGEARLLIDAIDRLA